MRQTTSKLSGPTSAEVHYKHSFQPCFFFLTDLWLIRAATAISKLHFPNGLSIQRLAVIRPTHTRWTNTAPPVAKAPLMVHEMVVASKSHRCMAPVGLARPGRAAASSCRARVGLVGPLPALAKDLRETCGKLLEI